MKTTTRLGRAGILALAIAVGVTAWLDAAAADKRVVVLDIEGTRSSALRDTVADLIAAEHEVVAGREWERAAQRMNITRMSPRNVTRLASQLGVDAVLEGTLVPDGKRYLLRLRLRDGTNGRTIKRVTLRLGAPQLSAKVQGRLAAELLDALAGVDRDFDEDGDDIEEAAPTAAERRAAERERRAAATAAERERREAERAERERERREAAREARQRQEREAAMRERRVASRDLDDDFDDEFDDDFDDDDFDDDFDDDGADRRRSRATSDASVSQRAKPAGDELSAHERASRGSMQLHVGASLTGREMTFSTRADFEQSPDFAGPNAPGIFATGEVYPMSDGEGLVSRLGAAFVVDQAFGLELALNDAMDTRLPTKQFRYGVGVRYRHSFGDKPTSPMIRVGVGYNQMGFVIDRSGAPEGAVVDVPNTKYTYLDPGVSLRWPVADKVAVTAAVAGMLLLGAGEIQQIDQYGTATLTGIDADAGLEIVATPRIVVRVVGRIAAIGYDFAGDGEQTYGRDGDPDTIDIGGALDRYLGGQVTVGYLF
jgi:hypothetical protein